MAYERCSLFIYEILIFSISLLVNCQKITNSTINGSTPELRNNVSVDNYTINNSSSMKKLFEKANVDSFNSNSTHNSILTSSERNEIMKPTMATGLDNHSRKPTELFENLSSRPIPTADSIPIGDTDFTSESSETNSTADLETTTSFDFLVALLRNSTQNDDVVLSCVCVPHFRCVPTAIVPQTLQNYKGTPKLRVEMENCSKHRVEVCCLKTSLGNTSESQGSRPASAAGNTDSTMMESSTESNTPADLETTTSFDDFLKELLGNSTQKDVVLSCVCAPYYRCDPGNIIIPQLQNDGVTPKERVEMENCSSDASESEVCCLKNTISVLDYKERVKAADRCGIRNVGGIANQSSQLDLYSDYGEFPWVVAILLKTDNYYKYRCAGSLIDRNVILTAAYCIFGRKVPDIKVRAGEWDTRNSDEFFPHQDRFLEKVIIHKEFNPKNLHNDIAILILKEPLTYHVNIGRICLTHLNSTDRFPVNASCFSTGWGKDSFAPEPTKNYKGWFLSSMGSEKGSHLFCDGIILSQVHTYHSIVDVGSSLYISPVHFKFDKNMNGSSICQTAIAQKLIIDSESLYKVIPKKVSLELVEHDTCQKLLRESRLGKYFILHESFVCAHDKNTCSGDGGSPLMCSFDSNPGVYQLLGMVAWGLGCGPRYPTAFVNIAHFRTWISDELNLAGIKTNIL